MWINRSMTDPMKRFQQTKEVHIVASGMKAVGGAHLSTVLQVCREACGGQGFKSSNKIGILRADTVGFYLP